MCFKPMLVPETGRWERPGEGSIGSTDAGEYYTAERTSNDESQSQGAKDKK